LQDASVPTLRMEQIDQPGFSIIISMKHIILSSFYLLAFGTIVYFGSNSASKNKSDKTYAKGSFESYEENELENRKKRNEYEWKLLHDPATGQIPRDIKRKEALLLQSVILKQQNAAFRRTTNNTYIPAGPSKLGGRTRAVVFDMRANQVVLAGGVSGGIFRSSDGGASWSFVHPANDVRNITCIVQDPRPDFQDTWYAGTGELIGDSPSYPNAFIPGYGILKSTDNGLTWTKLSSTIQGSRENYDFAWDYVFNVQVDINGVLYAAILNRVVRSVDGGNSWTTAIGSNTLAADPLRSLTEVAVVKNSTKVFAAIGGRNSNRDLVGVWTSPTGLNGSFTRIAGGRSGQTDSVPGWRAYNNALSGGAFTAGYGRIVLAVAPSNPNILYVMYDNAQSVDNNLSEADLFRADLSGASPVWSSNRGNFLRGSIDNRFPDLLATQVEYNMLLAVHPTNPNLVIAGGVNLYKSTNGFSSGGSFIGGEVSDTFSDPSGVSHVDFHGFAFDPSDPNRFVVANDGGLQVCPDITASQISWSLFANQYQTLQYYHVAIDPSPGSLVFAGGAQDNSTSYRDARGLFANILPDVNDHYNLIGGDGGAVGLTASNPALTTSQILYGCAQLGALYRQPIRRSASIPAFSSIKPFGSQEGEFITYFHLDPYNTETLYYTSYNELYRTNNASTVTTSLTSGWTNLTGVGTTVGSVNSIFALATSHGPYSSGNNHLFIGTSNGKIYRLADPRNATSTTAPVNITPATGMTASSLVRQIAVNPRNPDTVLAVVSNYGVASVFWTGNATKPAPTWQVIEGNIPLPSYRSCAIVVTSSGVEYYVGTSIGLFSTTSINGSSTSWTLEGPPVLQGALISDLALRASDNTLLIGTHGNGMYYTIIESTSTSVPNNPQNNPAFIASVYPTITSGDIQIKTGNLTGIRMMNVRVLDLNGKTVYTNRLNYTSGTLNLNYLPRGSYILEMISDNRKYKQVQKFIRQ